MIHQFFLIPKKTDMDLNEFHNFWLNVQGPTVNKIPNFSSYTQTHRIENHKCASTYFNGSAEIMWPNPDIFRESTKTDAWKEAIASTGGKFIDLSRGELLVGTDTEKFKSPNYDRSHKKVFCLIRRKHSFPEFRNKINSLVFTGIPWLTRCVITLTLDEAYQFSVPRWDGVAHLWVDPSFEAKIANSDVTALPLMELIDQNYLNFFFCEEKCLVNRT